MVAVEVLHHLLYEWAVADMAPLHTNVWEVVWGMRLGKVLVENLTLVALHIHLHYHRVCLDIVQEVQEGGRTCWRPNSLLYIK